MVKNDNGPGLRNSDVKTALLGIFATSLDVRTYSPTDKPYIERLLGTAESVLLKLIHGYTGRRAGDLPEYDAKANGVLVMEELYGIITRFFIDEYPSTRHYGMGLFGKRPAELYKEINETRGHFSPLDPHQRRIALGWEQNMTPTDEGVRVFGGIWLNSQALQSAIEEPGYAKVRGKARIFVDPDNMNRATVLLPRTKQPIEVELQVTAFADMTLPEILNLVEACRRETPDMTEIYEDRLAKTRRALENTLDRIGVERGLSRSFATRAECEAKARVIMRGCPIRRTPMSSGTVEPDQITAVDPVGAVFRFSDTDAVIEGTVVQAEPATGREAATDDCQIPENSEGPSPRTPIPAADTQPTPPRPDNTGNRSKPSPETRRGFMGRPANPKRPE